MDFGFKIKTKGSVHLSWKKWLKQNIGSSNSDVRKKREIARFIENYPCFKHLCITFNEFHTKRKSVAAMLNAYAYI